MGFNSPFICEAFTWIVTGNGSVAGALAGSAARQAAAKTIPTIAGKGRCNTNRHASQLAARLRRVPLGCRQKAAFNEGFIFSGVKVVPTEGIMTLWKL
jgi:hypothetical protein